MFEKKFLEIFLVLAYWFNFTPYMYVTCTNKNWLYFDLKDLDSTIVAVFVFVVLDILFFVVLYRIVMFAYNKIKNFEKAKMKKLLEKYKGKSKIAEETANSDVPKEWKAKL